MHDVWKWISIHRFNENCFTLYAVREDTGRNGVKIIGLAGNFSYDGKDAHSRVIVSSLHELQDQYDSCCSVADIRYLVEPISGLWLMVAEANVYLLKENIDPQYPDAASFSGSDNAGYNNMLT